MSAVEIALRTNLVLRTVASLCATADTGATGGTEESVYRADRRVRAVVTFNLSTRRSSATFLSRYRSEEKNLSFA
jgi:hypothetical protein